jgi:hypothetical protein
MQVDSVLFPKCDAAQYVNLCLVLTLHRRSTIPLNYGTPNSNDKGNRGQENDCIHAVTHQNGLEVIRSGLEQERETGYYRYALQCSSNIGTMK